MRHAGLIVTLGLLAGCGDASAPGGPSPNAPQPSWEGPRLVADAGEVPLSDCGVRDPPCRRYGDERYFPALAMNARGQGLLLWQQEDHGYRQWWSPVSTTSGIGAPRPTGQESGSYRPALAVDEQGRGASVWEWYLPWFDIVSASPPERPAVSRLSSAGEWSAPEELGTELDWWFDMDLHPGGAGVVLYDQGCGRYFVPGCPPGKRLFSARFRTDAEGLVHQLVRAESRFPCVQITSDAQVAATPDGAVALWIEYGNTSFHGCSEGFQDLWSSRLQPGGWSPAEPLARIGPLGRISDLDVAADDQGDGFAIYRSSERYDEGGVWVRAFTSRSWQEPVPLAGRGWSPRLAMNRRGDALAWWVDRETTPTGTWFYTLWARWYSKGLRAWSEPYPLPREAEVMFDESRAALDEDGHAILAWSTLYDRPYDVRASRFTAGRGFGPIEAMRPASATRFASRPAVASDARGGAFVAWAESDGQRVTIWANRYVVP